MDRRRATVIAAGTALTFLLAASAMTANAVILGRGSDHGVGRLQVVPASAPPATTAPAGGASTATSSTPTTPASVTRTDDDHERHEAEEPHEGRDDDD
jgi:hypothetical protein